MFHLYLFSIAIFMLIALQNLLTACLHPSRGLATQDFIFFHSIHLFNERVNQYIHSFIPYTGKLWKSLFLSIFPLVYDLSVKTHLMQK